MTKMQRQQRKAKDAEVKAKAVMVSRVGRCRSGTHILKLVAGPRCDEGGSSAGAGQAQL